MTSCSRQGHETSFFKRQRHVPALQFVNVLSAQTGATPTDLHCESPEQVVIGAVAGVLPHVAPPAPAVPPVEPVLHWTMNIASGIASRPAAAVR